MSKLTRTKQTNARDAHRPAPSSASEVITMLKRKKKHEDKEHGGGGGGGGGGGLNIFLTVHKLHFLIQKT